MVMLMLVVICSLWLGSSGLWLMVWMMWLVRVVMFLLLLMLIISMNLLLFNCVSMLLGCSSWWVCLVMVISRVLLVWWLYVLFICLNLFRFMNIMVNWLLLCLVWFSDCLMCCWSSSWLGRWVSGLCRVVWVSLVWVL